MLYLYGLDHVTSQLVPFFWQKKKLTKFVVAVHCVHPEIVEIET